MKELSLNILDITQNSLKAGAKNVYISIIDNFGDDKFVLTIQDDGCGMSEEMVESVRDPFCTSRKTRKVGLGIPFLVLAAEQTGGSVEIISKTETEFPDSHGTTITAIFHKNSIDFTPLGDIVSTLIVIIQGYPDVDYVFRHETDKGEVLLDTKDMREILGSEVSFAEFEVLEWIRGFLKESYAELEGDTVSE